MKSIFSTQNLQTFFFRKYWRLPRRGPPGPPPGPPSRRGPPGPPCPPPGPCPPGRGPLGADDCLCSSAIAAYLSRNLTKLFVAFGAHRFVREPFASKPRDLETDPANGALVRDCGRRGNPAATKHCHRRIRTAACATTASA